MGNTALLRQICRASTTPTSSLKVAIHPAGELEVFQQNLANNAGSADSSPDSSPPDPFEARHRDAPAEQF